MAEILIYSIEFLQDNPYGTYVIGDKLTVYVEESEIVSNYSFDVIISTGIHTYLNGIEVFSGPQIITAVSFISLETSNPQICFGTELFKPRLYGQFPYTIYVTEPNANACAVTPVTCDLIIVGSPTIVDATDEVTADGSITITATSSNSIEYKLGSDFLYGDGQVSSTFSGLLPGNYRIYLRDSKNCSANVYVTVDIVPDYGVLYRLEYYDFAGYHSKVEITERSYSGAVTEVKGTDNPVQIQLRGEAENNKFTAILPSQINVGIMSETNSQFIDLYTNDPNKYRVDFYKDTGSGYELKFKGKLMPFVYQEIYGATPYPVNFTATDGLGELEEYPFLQKDGLRFYGELKLIKIISFCLSYLKMDLGIRVAANIYSTGMNIAASDDPLDQAYVDVECFYLYNKDATLLSVIEAILKPFGARIVQWGGYWNIVRVEEMNASYAYRQYDSNGDYVSNSTFDPVLDIGYPNVSGDVMFTGIPNMELQNGYGKVTVNYLLGLRKNLIKNGDFELVSRFENEEYVPVLNKEGFTISNGGYPLLETYEVIDDNNVALVLYNPDTTVQGLGNAYILSEPISVKMGVGNQLKISVKYKVQAPNNFAPPYIKIRMRVQYGSLYLMGNGTWSSDVNTVEFLADKLNTYEEVQVIADQPTSGTPTSGMDLSIKLFHAHAYYTDYSESGSTTTQMETFATINLTDGHTISRKDSAATYTSGDYVYYYKLQPNTEAASFPNIISPDDYGAGNGNRKWVLTDYLAINDPQCAFFVDNIRLEYLYNGVGPLDKIVRSMTAEARNKLNFEDNIILGSSAEVITTEGNQYFDFGRILYGEQPRINVIETQVLSFGIVYTGWLRDSNGDAWDYWTRDGVSEEDKLHSIWLKMTSAQYNRSWRLLRCSLVSDANTIGLLNSFKELNDSNRIYIPMSMTINDKDNIAECELAEFIEADSGGSDNSGVAPFTSGFTTGFGPGFD